MNDDFESKIQTTLEAILVCVETNARVQAETTGMFFEIMKKQEELYSRVLNQMKGFMENASAENEKIRHETHEMILRSEQRVGSINEMVRGLVKLTEISRAEKKEYLEEYRHQIESVCHSRDKALDLASSMSSIVQALAGRPSIMNENKSL